MIIRRFSGLMLSTAVATTFLAPGAFAQDVITDDAAASEGEASSSGLGDIVVTAQRTGSSLQRTPIAVTAVSAEALQERQVRDVKDVGSLVPGLLIQPVSTSSNAARIVLRGVGQESGGILYDPGVAVYVDNVYEPRINGSFFDFFDIERLEVLRGPQGTLYGRNSSGGAIKVVTLKPSMTDREFRGDLTYGTFNALSARAYVNVPLATDTLAVSGSFVIRTRDGFIEAPAYGRDIGRVNTLAARTKLLFTPSDRFELELAASYMRDRGDSGIGSPLTVLPGVTNPFASPTRDIYRTELSGPQLSDVDSIGASANARYKISDALTLVSITGYRWLNLKQASPFNQRVNNTDAGGDYKATNYNFSQELDLEFDFDWIKGVAGLYYFNERGTQVRGFLNVPSGYSTPHTLHRKTEALAAFAEVNAEIVSDVSLVAGIRATKEKAYLSQIYPTIGNVLQVAEDSFNAVTPKVGVNWQVTPDMMVYASFTKGFKSGGFNNITPTLNVGTGLRPGPEVYNPETVESYEAGVKFTTADRRLRLNVAVFQADYKGLQLPALIPGTGISTTRNATSARIRGIELEPTWQPFDALEFYGAIAFSDGKYTGPYNCANANGVFVDCSVNEIKGLVPEQATLGFTLKPDLGIGGQFKLGGDWQYTSFYYNNVSNDLLIAQSKAVGLFNGFISWTDDSERWSVALEGRNLADKAYYRNALQISNAISPSVLAYPGEPRTVNIRVGFAF